MKKIAWSRLTPLFSVAIFALALWLLRKELRHFHYRDILAYLNGLPLDRVLLAIGCTLAGYLALTGYDTLGFRYIGRPIAYWKAALASFVGYAFSNSLGMPLLTGTPLRVRFYTGWGLTALDAARVMLFSYVTFWLGFLGLSGVAFVLEPVPLPPAVHIGITTARPLGVLFLVLVAAYLVFSTLHRQPFSIKGLELGIPSPPIAGAQILVAAVDWACAAAVLYALFPPEWSITFPQLLGVFLLSQIVGLLSHVPGGLGVFESLMVLLLPPELPRPQLLAALVAFRGVYYFLPLLAASVVLSSHELIRRRAAVGRIARLVGDRMPLVVPPVLALTTFLGGAILLISGATPAIHSRLHWLKDFLPLSLIEISHFLGSLAGAGLLFLAFGLQRRLDVAYQLTLLLLASGIVFSLAKGLDYEEAIVLAIMLAALLPCHSHFYRKASLTAETFTPSWIAAIATVLVGTLWLGLFAYKHVDYSRDLWWHFTVAGNAPRFLRASVGVAAVALGISLWRLFRPAPPEPAAPTAEDLAKAAALVAFSPRTYAYLALLGDKEILFNDAATAFIMFGVERRSWVAMGDPVGPLGERRELAWSYRELVDRHAGWTCFYQVSERNLHIYVDLGLSLVKLGEEARVALPGFSLEGRNRKKLRHAHRRCIEHGCALEIVEPDAVAALMPTLQRISDQWLETKNTREKSFSLGFFDPEYLHQLPVALVRHEGRIVAFANLWRGAQQEELSLDLMRQTDDAPLGVMDFLFCELMLRGAREGYRWFNLGMAPLAGLEARSVAPFWSKLGAMVFRHGEHFYNFQGLRLYKDKFDPVWEARYLACPGGLVLPRVLGDIATLISRGFRGMLAR
jgi:phosphatidylglycerol lysyltransferase